MEEYFSEDFIFIMTNTSTFYESVPLQAEVRKVYSFAKNAKGDVSDPKEAIAIKLTEI